MTQYERITLEVNEVRKIISDNIRAVQSIAMQGADPELVELNLPAFKSRIDNLELKCTREVIPLIIDHYNGDNYEDIVQYARTILLETFYTILFHYGCEETVEQSRLVERMVDQTAQQLVLQLGDKLSEYMSIDDSQGLTTRQTRWLVLNEVSALVLVGKVTYGVNPVYS